MNVLLFIMSYEYSSVITYTYAYMRVSYVFNSTFYLRECMETNIDRRYK